MSLSQRVSYVRIKSAVGCDYGTPVVIQYGVASRGTLTCGWAAIAAGHQQQQQCSTDKCVFFLDAAVDDDDEEEEGDG